jgi:hypothetical protein
MFDSVSIRDHCSAGFDATNTFMTSPPSPPHPSTELRTGMGCAPATPALSSQAGMIAAGFTLAIEPAPTEISSPRLPPTARNGGFIATCAGRSSANQVLRGFYGVAFDPG